MRPPPKFGARPFTEFAGSSLKVDDPAGTADPRAVARAGPAKLGIDNWESQPGIKISHRVARPVGSPGCRQSPSRNFSSLGNAVGNRISESLSTAVAKGNRDSVTRGGRQ